MFPSCGNYFDTIVEFLLDPKRNREEQTLGYYLLINAGLEKTSNELMQQFLTGYTNSADIIKRFFYNAISDLLSRKGSLSANTVWNQACSCWSQAQTIVDNEQKVKKFADALQLMKLLDQYNFSLAVETLRELESWRQKRRAETTIQQVNHIVPINTSVLKFPKPKHTLKV